MKLQKYLDRNRPPTLIGGGGDGSSGNFDDIKSTSDYMINIKEFIFQVMDNKHVKGHNILNVYAFYKSQVNQLSFETGINYTGYTLLSNGLEFYLITDIGNNTKTRPKLFYFYDYNKLRKIGYLNISNNNDIGNSIYLDIFKQASKQYYNFILGSGGKNYV